MFRQFKPSPLNIFANVRKLFLVAICFCLNCPLEAHRVKSFDLFYNTKERMVKLKAVAVIRLGGNTTNPIRILLQVVV